MVVGDGPLAAVRGYDGYIGRFGEFYECLFGIGDGDTATGVD